MLGLMGTNLSFDRRAMNMMGRCPFEMARALGFPMVFGSGQKSSVITSRVDECIELVLGDSPYSGTTKRQ